MPRQGRFSYRVTVVRVVRRQALDDDLLVLNRV
jgi:hypothetical protein